MASLPTIKRLSREDIREAPSWVERLIYPLNLFFDSVYTALNKNLTFKENFIAQIQTFEILAGASPADNVAQFALTMPVIPRNLLLGNVTLRAGNYTPVAAAVHIDWNIETSVVYINAVTGLIAGQTYDFSVILV